MSAARLTGLLAGLLALAVVQIALELVALIH
jgi:hypothetical protein